MSTATSTPFPLDPNRKANYFHLYADVIGFGILAGSSVAFIAVYAARLGATAIQLSLLTAGPAVINLLFSLPAGQWLEGRSLTKVSFQAAALSRLGYLLLIPLPLLLPNLTQVWIIILITLIMSIPGTVLSIAFNAILADLIPPDDRATVVGRRSALTSLAMTLAVLLSGQLLDILNYPVNYVIVFSLGTIGGFFSTTHLKKLRVSYTNPPHPAQLPDNPVRRGRIRLLDSLHLPAGLRSLPHRHSAPLLRLDVLRGSFGVFLTAYLFFYTCQFVPVAIAPLYIVNNLEYTDGIISLGNALFF
ncbi:MAG TPA: MFS transporter, partial [Anaerolineales bacterium]|nr:MFS transporter [Anaerolineales bacterium]